MLLKLYADKPIFIYLTVSANNIHYIFAVYFTKYPLIVNGICLSFVILLYIMLWI